MINVTNFCENCEATAGENMRLRERLANNHAALSIYRRDIAALRERVAALESELEYIRDLARTGLPSDGYNSDNWDVYKLNRIAAKADRILPTDKGGER